MGEPQPFRLPMAVVVEDDEDQRYLSATVLEEADTDGMTSNLSSLMSSYRERWTA